MVSQKYSSGKTSLNQICAIYTTFTKPGKMLFRPGDDVLDYGGGKFDKGKNYMAQYGVNVYIYDLFNRTETYNERSLRQFMKGNRDFIICSNVLNVIQEDSVIRGIVANIRKLSTKNTTIIFLIHEGDRTGIGRQTKEDSWQRNEKAADYLRFMSGFSTVQRKGKFIFCRK